MATAKQIRAAVAEGVRFAFEHYPNDIERRCDCFVSFLSGWLDDDEPSITADLRRLQGRQARPDADGA